MAKKDFSEIAKSDFKIPETKGDITKKGIREGTKRGLNDASAWMVRLDRIKPDSNQVRKKFDKDKLEELSNSIKEKGVLQPIIVEYDEDEDLFKILSGERRYRAAQIAGKEDIPCIVYDRDKIMQYDERLLQQLTENIQREDLDPVDQAYAIKRLLDASGLTQEEVGRKIGKSQEYVSNCVKIIENLPDEIKDDYKELSREHLLQLARLKDDDRKKELLNKVKDESLSAKDLRSIVSKELKARRGPKPFKSKFSGKDYSISVTFRRQKIDTEELISALKEWIKKLEEERH